jgi:hypothetical protein
VKYRAIAAALAIVAAPVAINGAGAQEKSTASNPQRKICDVQIKTGSRLGGSTRCQTREERIATQAEARRTVDRIQAMRPTMCPPAGC